MNTNSETFYPATSTWGVGHTSNQYTDSASEFDRSLQPISCEAYYLGWVDSDNLPCLMGTSTVAESDNVIKIESDIVPGRYPCGYIGTYGRNDGYSFPVGLILKNGIVQYSEIGTGCYFLNDVHPEYYAYYAGSYSNRVYS